MISNEKYLLIEALDFSAIRRKLTHPTRGEGWSNAKAEAVEIDYKRFLCVHLSFPGEPAVPTVEVDTFWHHHILDTMQYAADCERAFGHFLHHCPSLDLPDSDQSGREREAVRRTRELYAACFGEAGAATLAYATATGQKDGLQLNAGHGSARCVAACLAMSQNAASHAPSQHRRIAARAGAKRARTAQALLAGRSARQVASRTRA